MSKNNRSTRRAKRQFVWIAGGDIIRLTLAACVIALATMLVVVDIPAARTWSYWTLPLSGKVIAVDAGHGGADGGAVSRSGLIEKDLNLSIALYLRDYLQQAGALVMLTREGDYDLAENGTKGLAKRKTQDLLERADRMRDRRTDLAISIHMNSVPSSRWSGAQTFYYSRNPESVRLAQAIQAEIRESLGNTSREANVADNIYVLRTVPMPTALVEVGFLSHPEEAKRLADEQYQIRVAAAIYRGILRYNS